MKRPLTGHYVLKCRHGVVVSQCRCPGPKDTRIVSCPPACYRQREVD